MYKLPASHCHRQLAHSASLYHTVRAMLGNRTWATEFKVLHTTTVPQIQNKSQTSQVFSLTNVVITRGVEVLLDLKYLGSRNPQLHVHL